MNSSSLIASLGRGDVLLIVPPFAGLDKPSMGAHVLQACALATGFRVKILYANFFLAEMIGVANYVAMAYGPTSELLGERFFASVAYSTSQDLDAKARTINWPEGTSYRTSPELYAEHSKLASQWLDELAGLIAELQFPIVGATTTFEQTSASIAILNLIKKKNPTIVTIIGGANCEGEMAEGIQSIGSKIDVIFSGESESSFPDFLSAHFGGRSSPTSVIRGEPCMNMDRIPTVDYKDFYTQRELVCDTRDAVKEEMIWLPYETSRGCWWGAKHHCTFCGLNAVTMAHRQKSPDRVIEELTLLLKSHPNRMICMVDNIMPHNYFKDLLPRLHNEVPNIQVFYEQKANLTFEQVVALKQSGINIVQPGIESLSTAFLKRMDKGVTARQNISLLRYARIAELTLNWNLLYAFPGDQLEEYTQTLNLIPLIRHLNPPSGVSHLSIDRFSPYYDSHEKYDVSNIMPMPGYLEIYPKQANVEKIAYHFVADYPTASRVHSEIVDQLKDEVETWRNLWQMSDSAPPTLNLSRVGDDKYLIIDTRGIDPTQQFRFCNFTEAKVVLGGASEANSNEVVWAIENKFLIQTDGVFMPIATAEFDLFREFETYFASAKAAKIGHQPKHSQISSSTNALHVI